MNNIKPATPLPYEAGFKGPDRHGRLDWVIYADHNCAFTVKGGDKQDAAYIVHAANAYPQLVAALRGLLDAMPCDDYAPDTYGGEQIAQARAILKSLGEA